MITVTTPCGVTHVFDHGATGRPLVLIHGWGGRAAQWDGIVPGLSGVRVLCAEMPGGPGLPLTGPVSIAGLGQGIAACLANLALSDVLLVGHSMGGPVAVEVALAAPDRVTGILGLDTLADQVYYGGSDPTEIATRRAVFTADPEGETRRMINAITAPDTPRTLCDEIATDILTARVADLADLRDAMFSWRIADRVPRLAIPLRLLNSHEVHARHTSAPLPCLDLIPQSVYGSGHFPQIEAPERLLPHLARELQWFGVV